MPVRVGAGVTDGVGVFVSSAYKSDFGMDTFSLALADITFFKFNAARSNPAKKMMHNFLTEFFCFNRNSRDTHQIWGV